MIPLEECLVIGTPAGRNSSGLFAFAVVLSASFAIVTTQFDCGASTSRTHNAPDTSVDCVHNMAKQYVIKTLSGNLNATVGDIIGGGLWKWEDGTEKTFTVKSPIRKGSPSARSGITAAPDIMDVVDLVDGGTKRILVGKVLSSTLLENFPDDSYVGKSFRAVQGPPPAGKRYKSMTVQEVVIEGPAEEKKSKK
jgi:hypothetical protein